MRIACLALIFLLAGAGEASAAALGISNHTDQEIINILLKNPAREFFLRLDLLPLASDEVENPDCVASLRADTGLELWSFPDINLGRATNLDFCGEHPVCLIVSGKDHVAGVAESLIPDSPGQIVCALDKFRSAMRMSEVCSLLAPDSPRDDNGAILAGLGFADMAWSARLAPEITAENDPQLQHIELRRRLNPEDLDKLLQTLAGQGYVIWQAEFPGFHYDYDPTKPAEADLVPQKARAFLAAQAKSGHSDHAAGERCEEASLLLAPESLLPVLRDSDEPASDVQIFNIILRPCANTLLVDLAAYRKS